MTDFSKMTLPDFLAFRLTPISEELAASGAGHVIACYVPDAAHMKIVSDLPPVEKAHRMRAMGEALLREAEKLEKGEGSIIMPGSKAS